MSSKIIIAFILMLSLGCESYGAKNIGYQAKKSYKSIKNLTANITISTYSNLIGHKIYTQTGVIFIKFPDKFDLEIQQPKKHTSVLSGNRYVVKDLGMGVCIRSTLPSGQYINAAGATSYFDLSRYKPEGNQYIFVSRPFSKSAPIECAVFCLNSKTYLPEKVIFKNIGVDVSPFADKKFKSLFALWLPFKKMGEILRNRGIIRTDMIFENIRVNTPIDENKFKID